MANQRPIKSLSDLMDGGVEERFNQELERVWDNVCDPNTPAKAARKVTLEVKIVPTERRDSCDFKVSCTSKLAANCELSHTVMLNFGDDGSIIATERTNQLPGQLDIEGNEAPIPRVMRFSREQEAQ